MEGVKVLRNGKGTGGTGLDPYMRNQAKENRFYERLTRTRLQGSRDVTGLDSKRLKLATHVTLPALAENDPVVYLGLT